MDVKKGMLVDVSSFLCHTINRSNPITYLNGSRHTTDLRGSRYML